MAREGETTDIPCRLSFFLLIAYFFEGIDRTKITFMINCLVDLAAFGIEAVKFLLERKKVACGLRVIQSWLIT